MPTPIANPPNWEEVLPGEPFLVLQAYNALQSTFLDPNNPSGPTTFNYENLSFPQILKKMGPRSNTANTNINPIQGLRICHRIAGPPSRFTGISPIDMVVFFFLRLRRWNSQTAGEAYCVTVGLDASVTDPNVVYSDVLGICRYVKQNPANAGGDVNTFEIIHLENLATANAFASLTSGAVLQAAFNGALGPYGSAPGSGQLKNPPSPIRLGKHWRPNSTGTVNTWFSWVMNL